jgi:hypothetical protein
MLGPSRPFPKLQAGARVVHFGGGSELATIVRIQEEGRRLNVRCESGELLEFVLNPATARFVLAGDSHGPRLDLLDGVA